MFMPRLPKLFSREVAGTLIYLSFQFSQKFYLHFAMTQAFCSRKQISSWTCELRAQTRRRLKCFIGFDVAAVSTITNGSNLVSAWSNLRRRRGLKFNEVVVSGFITWRRRLPSSQSATARELSLRVLDTTALHLSKTPAIKCHSVHPTVYTCHRLTTRC